MNYFNKSSEIENERSAHQRMTLVASASKRVMLYGAVIAILFYSFFPIYWMIVSSLRPRGELFSSTSLLLFNSDLHSYKILLTLTNYITNFINSVLVAGGTVIITMIMATFIAYGATRLQFRGKTLIVIVLLFAYMFPPLMLAIPMAVVFSWLNIYNSLFGLLIAHLSIALPLGVFLLWGFFKAMPFELEEAAMIDGCSQFSAFYKIILPLAAPGLITVGIFAFLLSWADYVFALILVSNDEIKTLPVALASMLGAQDLQWGPVLAGASLIALPLLIVFVFCYRYFVAGLTAGALKG